MVKILEVKRKLLASLQVSEKAQDCPHCGDPFIEKQLNNVEVTFLSTKHYRFTAPCPNCNQPVTSSITIKFN